MNSEEKIDKLGDFMYKMLQLCGSEKMYYDYFEESHLFSNLTNNTDQIAFISDNKLITKDYKRTNVILLLDNSIITYNFYKNKIFIKKLIKNKETNTFQFIKVNEVNDINNIDNEKNEIIGCKKIGFYSEHTDGKYKLASLYGKKSYDYLYDIKNNKIVEKFNIDKEIIVDNNNFNLIKIVETLNASNNAQAYIGEKKNICNYENSEEPDYKEVPLEKAIDYLYNNIAIEDVLLHTKNNNYINNML